MATRNTKTNPKKYLPSAQSKSLDIEPREIVLDPDASMQDGLDSLLRPDHGRLFGERR